MALNIYTQSFFDIKKDFDNFVQSIPEQEREAFLANEEQTNKFLKQYDTDTNEFYNAYNELAREEQKGVKDFRPKQIQLDDDPETNYLESTLGSIVRTGGRTLGEFGEYLKLLPGIDGSEKRSFISQYVPKDYQHHFDPYHGEGTLADVENIGGQLATFLMPGTLAVKIASAARKANIGSKGIKKLLNKKITPIAAVGVASAAHESILNNTDYTALDEISKTEDGRKLLEQIDNDPNDRQALNLLRNFAQNLAIEGAFLGTGLAVKKGYKAFKNTKTGNAITRFGQKYLTTRRGTDDEFLASTLARNKASQAAMAKAEGIASDLEKSLKKNDADLYERYRVLNQEGKFLDSTFSQTLEEKLEYIPRTNEDILSAALGGHKEAFNLLSPKTKELVSEMRSNIDEMSNYLGNAFKGKLETRVNKNIGFYLNRSYKIFDDDQSGYRKKLTNAVEKYRKTLNDNVSPINKRFKKNVPNSDEDFDTIVHNAYEYLKRRSPELPDSTIGVQLKNLLNKSDEDGIFEFFNLSNSKGGLTGSSKATLKRDRIPKDIRMFLGQVKSPYQNYIKTVGKLATMTAEHEYVEEVIPKLLEKGIVKYYTDKDKVAGLVDTEGLDILNDTLDQRANLIFGRGAFGNKLSDGFQVNSKKIDKVLEEAKYYNRPEEIRELYEGFVKDYSFMEGLNPDVGKLYISREYNDMLSEMLSDKGPGKFLSIWGANKGITQAAKTVYNPATHGRNIIGNILLLGANGFTPFSGEGSKALSSTISRISGNTNKEQGEFLAKMIKYGIADSSVTLGLIKEGLKSFSTTDKNAPLAQRLFSKVGSNKIAKTYEGEDYIFKVMHFEKTLEQMKKAFPNESIEQLEQRAAQRTRDLMPNYDLVPKGFKAMRYAPIGDFIAFPAEMARVSKNLVKYTLDDLFSDNSTLQKAAAIRLAGTTAMGSLPYYMQSLSADIHNISPEEQEAIESIDLPFYVGSPKLFTSSIKENKRGDKSVDVVRLGPGDPFEPIKLAGQALHSGLLLTGEALGLLEKDKRNVLANKVALAALDRTVAPFVGTSILTDGIISLMGDPLSERVPDTASGDLGKYLSRVFAPDSARSQDIIATAVGKGLGLYEPGFVTFLKKRVDYANALEAERARTGQEEGYVQAYNKYFSPMGNNIALEAFGFGPRPLDITGSYYRNIGTRFKSINELDNNYRRKFNLNIGDRGAEDFINQYDTVQNDRLKTMAEIRQLHEYYSTLGFGESDIEKGLTQLGTKAKPKEYFSTKDFEKLYNIIRDPSGKGSYIPTEITSSLFNSIENAFENDQVKINRIKDTLLSKELDYLNQNIEGFNRPKIEEIFGR
tara:strand:- start:42 stop:4046 length:4005 start_codon:yes stop_codon:yes gene_type:complete